MQEAGGAVALVSGGFTPVIAPRAAQLGITEVHANGSRSQTVGVTGRTEGRVVDPAAKAEIFSALVAHTTATPSGPWRSVTVPMTSA